MKAPSFQFYAQDFLTGVVYLTNEEIGIYIKMLCKQWTDGKIPKKRLGLLVGYEWDNLSDELKGKFTENGGFVFNERLEKEREKREIFMEKQRLNGKKGGRPNKGKTQKKPKRNPTVNPKKTQKKPLEDEDGSIVIEDKEVVKEIIYPFESDFFMDQWEHWKTFKKKEFNFKYKSIQSEQASLSELAKLSNNNEQNAIGIIHQSMANGWRGFFELKNKTPEKTINRQTEETIRQNLDTTGYEGAFR